MADGIENWGVSEKLWWGVSELHKGRNIGVGAEGGNGWIGEGFKGAGGESVHQTRPRSTGCY